MSSGLLRMIDRALSTQSETEKETADTAEAGNVEAPAPIARQRERALDEHGSTEP